VGQHRARGLLLVKLVLKGWELMDQQIRWTSSKKDGFQQQISCDKYFWQQKIYLAANWIF
jgi:hypothetical protein